MRRAWVLMIPAAAVAGSLIMASASGLQVTSKDLTVLSIDTTPPPTSDTIAPTPTGLEALNGTASSGDSGDGRAEPGDSIAITFSEPLKASMICASWPDNPTTTTSAVTITVNLVNGSPRDKVTFTGCSIGEILLGSGGYTNSGGATFGGSTVTWNPTTTTLVVVLGSATSGTAQKETNAGSPNVYTPAAGIQDLAGNAVTGTASVTDAKFF